MRPKRAGGGFGALWYSLARSREAGGVLQLTRRLRTHNACKTCAVGMSGMVNERGAFPEVCKKSIQAQAADMQPPIEEAFFRTHDVDALARLSGRELEAAGRIGFPVLCRDGERVLSPRRLGRGARPGVRALRQRRRHAHVLLRLGRSSNEATFLLQCFARSTAPTT
jgi:hypothetical protein